MISEVSNSGMMQASELLQPGRPISRCRTHQAGHQCWRIPRRAGGDFQVNLNAIEKLTGAKPRPSTYYIKVKEGANPRAVANEVEKAFLSSSLEATVSADAFAQGQAITRGILRLFQGFMALGLLVGIAALGVISSRSVVERRQQVGMFGQWVSIALVAFTFAGIEFYCAHRHLTGALTGWRSVITSCARSSLSDAANNLQHAVGQILLILLLAWASRCSPRSCPPGSTHLPGRGLRYE
jgi:hypothetical protein